MLVARIDQPRKAFAADILTAFDQRIGAQRQTFFAQFLTALAETRRKEAERIIRRYGHLLDGAER